MNEYAIQNAFVAFFIALESILLKEDEWSKSQRLQEFIDTILRYDKQQDPSLGDKVKGLYKIRSELIHQGKDRVTQDDLYELSQIAFRCIISLLKLSDKFQDKSQLRVWLNNEKIKLGWNRTT
jgi:hypothetical protein